MRAAFAIPGDLGTPTGGYVYARRLIREAPRHGIALEPLSLPDGFPAASPAMLMTVAERLAALPPGRPVLIDGLVLGVLPEMMLRNCPSPVVALCHHPLALETGLSAEDAADLRLSERRALACVEHVIPTSQATAAILMAEYGVPAERLTVAPPGTDPAPRATGSGEVCEILCVGSLTRRKGHDRLVKALARNVAEIWRLRSVGPNRDPAFAEDLVELIAAEGLAERVTLTGTLSMAELAAAYQQADLFVLASEYEGFGMAFAEAMAHGLPVLGLACPAVEEATAGAARLVPAAEFDAALKVLMTNKTERMMLADRCWTAAQTLMRWPQTMAIVARVMKGLNA